MAGTLDNPFYYKDDVGLDRAALNSVSLVLTTWEPEVIRYGKDLLVFGDFLENRTDRAFGKAKGETYTVPIYNWEDVATTALTVGTSITVGTQSVDSVSISLAEYGRGISKEGKIDYISNIANAQELQITIAQQWADTFNELAGKVFSDSVWGVYTVGNEGSHSALGTNLTDDSQKGTGTITGTMISYVYQQLRKAKVRRFPTEYGQLYLWVGNAETLQAVKDEAGWENLQLYNRGGEGIIHNVLGPYKGFLFVETEEGLVKGKSYAFGQGVGAYGFALPMHIAYYPDYHQDAGRLQVWKWHTILGLGATLRDKGTTCIVVKSGMD